MANKLNFKNRLDAPTKPVKPTAFDRFGAAEQLTAGTGRAVPSERAQEALITPTLLGTLEVSASASDFESWCIENDYVPGSITNIPLKAVKTSPYNPRHFYRKESIASFALNLSTQGQQQPIHVTPDYRNSGSFFVHDGGRRVRALNEIHRSEVKAIVVDVPQGVASYKLGYTLNTQQETQTVFDNAVVWKRLLQDGEFESQSALAEQLGVDKSTITMTLSVAELPEDLIEQMLLSAAQFGMNTSYAVVKYHRARGSLAAQKLIQRIIDEGLSVRQVNEIVRGTEGSTAPAEKQSRQRYQQRFDFSLPGGERMGEMRTYGEDKLTLSLKGLPREFRDLLQERFQAVVEEETKKFASEID